MCENCKYAKDIKGAYCYCRKKGSLTQMSKQSECKKFEAKEIENEN